MQFRLQFIINFFSVLQLNPVSQAGKKNHEENDDEDNFECLSCCKYTMFVVPILILLGTFCARIYCDFPLIHDVTGELNEYSLSKKKKAFKY